MLSPKELLKIILDYCLTHKAKAAVIGIALGVLGAAATYGGVEITSTVDFCTRCQ